MGINPWTDKARGAYFTPPEVSEFMVRWALRTPNDRILEPSCGSASFLAPAGQRLLQLGARKSQLTQRLSGIDIHGPSLEDAARRLAADGFMASLRCGDFFDEEPEHQYDAVIGNPPYIRYQGFSGEARAKSLRAVMAQGVRLNGLASSWAAFTVHASGFLNDAGRLAFVLPAELLSVNYAAEVRRYLLRRFAKVRLVLIEELVFPDALEEVVLLLAEGRGNAHNFEVYQVKNVSDLATLDTSIGTPFAPDHNGKWTPALLPAEAVRVYRSAIANDGFAQLLDWGETFLGAVTGNNKYFTLTASEAARLGLSGFDLLRISPPGSRHLRGLTFSKRAWQQLAKQGAKCYLFCPPSSFLSEKASCYVAGGQKVGVHQAYKCRARKPWWRVPLVPAPDLLFTYMNHDRPRLTTNEAGTHILNSLYGVSLKLNLQKVGRELLPIAALNSLTLLGAEIVGRAYGGGLLKHEPKEADRLPVPSPAVLAEVAHQLAHLKPQAAAALRRNDVQSATELVDRVILIDCLGIKLADVKALREAREVLFNRRISRGKKKRGEN